MYVRTSMRACVVDLWTGCSAPSCLTDVVTSSPLRHATNHPVLFLVLSASQVDCCCHIGQEAICSCHIDLLLSIFLLEPPLPPPLPPPPNNRRDRVSFVHTWFLCSQVPNPPSPPGPPSPSSPSPRTLPVTLHSLIYWRLLHGALSTNHFISHLPGPHSRSSTLQRDCFVQ